MVLQMDNTWKVFDDITDDFENFVQKIVPDLYLKPEVHTDVIEHIRIIRKLLELSYFEYKFCDVAALQTMMTMEMALRLRYEEINAEKWNKKLYLLIKWFEDRNYFEVYNSYYLDSLRQIRNELAHPSAHRFSGASAIHLIENVIDLINGLYEDPLLRKGRMDITRQIIAKLDGFKKGIKCCISDKSEYLAYCAWPGFINNKIFPADINFYFNPIFTISTSYLQKSNWVVPPAVHFRACYLEFSDDKILLINSEGERLLISEIDRESAQIEFSKWKDTYEKHCYPTGNTIYVNEELTDTFSLHLREFHKL